jgi:hypothetical protein
MSSGSETRQAIHRVTVRFTPEAFDQVTAAAKRAGFESVGEFLRVRAIGPGKGKPSVRLPQIDRLALVQALAEMGRVGSNVNQIARAVNSGGDLPQAAPLRDIQADLAETLAAVRKALGR